MRAAQADPHIHCLVTDGVFDPAGSFHPVSGIDSD
ncbi:MAG: transposase [Acidobacteria bacterium]|nr:transposase [Acidobacteriota bacterium]MBU4306301.1 transposase [Acidobacteriota bacterium]MBU4404582.1 transposase [Acidobacteriota bacterium]